MRPEVVVFDLGKVLLDFDYHVAAQRIAALSSKTAEEVKHLLDHSPLLFRLETAQMTPVTFYSQVVAGTGFTGSYEEFCVAFADIFTEIPELVGLQGELRKKGVPTYVFSNTNDIAIAHIRNRFPFYSQFDGYILSYEHGVMKPDAGLYEVVERMSGRRGSQILYLDDRGENITAGAARGWQTILQVDPARSVGEVRKLHLL